MAGSPRRRLEHLTDFELGQLRLGILGNAREHKDGQSKFLPSSERKFDLLDVAECYRFFERLVLGDTPGSGEASASGRPPVVERVIAINAPHTHEAAE